MTTSNDQNAYEKNNTIKPKNPQLTPDQIRELVQQRIKAVESGQNETGHEPKSNSPNSANNTNQQIVANGKDSGGPSEDWGVVKPFLKLAPGKPYPLEALPTILREAVEEVQSYVQSPVAMVANSAMACLATACQTHINVKRDNNLTGPTSLFFLTLAESGERKTTCDGFFSDELRGHQKKCQVDSQEDVKKSQSDLEKWRAKVEGYKGGIKHRARGGKVKDGMSLEDLEKKLEETMKNEPIAPKVPMILRTDDTPEMLCSALMHEWPSVGIISSEGGMVFSSRALNKDNIGNTLAMYNTLWDGGSWHIGRKTTKSFTVEGARLTMGVQLQPQVLDQFLDAADNLARQIGFIARCLFSFPDSTQGSRPYKNPPIEMIKLLAFNRQVRRILEAEPHFENGILKPFDVKLSDTARRVWIEFHDKCEVELGHGKKYEFLRDVTSKIADNAARLAGLFSALSGFPILEVDMDSMERACRVVQWHLDEANRYFGAVDYDKRKIIRNAKALEGWLVKKARSSHNNLFTRSNCLQYGPSCVQNAESLSKALKVLTNRNRVRLRDDESLIELNPLVIAIYDQEDEI